MLMSVNGNQQSIKQGMGMPYSDSYQQPKVQTYHGFDTGIMDSKVLQVSGISKTALHLLANPILLANLTHGSGIQAMKKIKKLHVNKSEDYTM